MDKVVLGDVAELNIKSIRALEDISKRGGKYSVTEEAHILRVIIAFRYEGRAYLIKLSIKLGIMIV